MSTADPFELARAEVLMRGYDARYAEEMSAFEVLAVEAEFRAPLVNPLTRQPSRTWRLAGKLDVLVRETRTGRKGVVEHKTAGVDVSMGSDYWPRLRMDGQVSLYYEGARALGHDPQFCLYDVIRKPLQRPSAVPILDDAGAKIVLDANGQRVRTKDGKKWRETGDAGAGYVLQTRPETVDEYRVRLLNIIAEDPNSFFVRGEVVRLDGEVADALFDVWQLGKQIREAHNAGRFPRNPDACVRYNQTCFLFDICTGAANLEDASRFRRVVDIHPELTPVEAELEHLSHGQDLLTASRLSCARACARLHHLKYELGYRPAAEDEALRFGSLMHRGLEQWWKARDGERLEAALSALTATPANGSAAAEATP